MKVAVLILAHREIKHLLRLLRALDDPRLDVFVHIDLKSDLDPKQVAACPLQYSKLTVLPRRHRIYWGDISMVDAMLTLYRTALAEPAAYERFIMLSGEDYPLVSNEEICRRIFETEQEFILPSPLHRLPRVTRYSYWPYLKKKFLVRCVRKGLDLLHIRKKPYLTVDGRRWEVCVASQWHILTRRCVMHILNTMDNHPEIRRYFRYSHAPDEMVIATIVHNTGPSMGWNIPEEEWRERTFHELAYTHYLKPWNLPGSTVEVFTERAFEDAVASGKLFIRKVRCGTSDILLEKIDGLRNKC